MPSQNDTPTPIDPPADDVAPDGAAQPQVAASRRRRLSPVRVMVAIFLVVAVAGGSAAMVRRTIDGSATGSKDAWFAPYVDATLVPSYAFENPADGAPKDVVLGFVVADRDGACEPTWGTFVDLQGAATAFDLDRRIARLRSAGGEPVVSFGGLTNDELALRCETPEALADAYGKVVSRYHLSTIDIDVEGTALADDYANLRRGAALTALQKKAAKKGKPLAVWLTVPVGVDGMTEAGQKLVATTIAAGVDLAGVNGMVMDYGAGRPAGTSMAQANEQALLALHRQLSRAYRVSGTTLTSAQVWAKVGATPMIGQNDTRDDVFTLGDARTLLSFARVHGMGRLSMWSANRDAQCGKQIEDAAVSNTCSGQEQELGEFGRILDNLTGRPMATGSDDGDSPSTTIDRTSARAVVDDARTSPYPIWQADTPYPMGEKVVWHGNVYEAKWWTRTDMPDAPVEHEWDTPWHYLGPVLPTDKPAPRPDIPEGTYPKWSEVVSYTKGTRVLFRGMAYEAKWYSLGDTPKKDRHWESPWQPVTDVPPPTSTTTTTTVVPKPAAAPTR